MPVIFKALWQYRFYVIASIRNEMVLRFARSRLGATWAVLNPLAMVMIYALILSNVLQAKMSGIDHEHSFAIYLTAGILCWSLFLEIINRSITVFTANGNLIKKALFPKIILPVALLGSCIVDNMLLLLAIIGVFAIFGHIPGIEIVWLPLLILITAALGISLGLILGILNVFIRDVAQIVPIVLQILFWFTPIVYPISIIPERYHELLYLNPVYPLVQAYQNILVFSRSPDWPPLLVTIALSAILITLAFFMFSRASEEMADHL